MSRTAIIAATVTAYIIGALLTFGYGANRACTLDWNTGQWNASCDRYDDGARFLFAVWPIYWAARGAIEVTKP